MTLRTAAVMTLALTLTLGCSTANTVAERLPTPPWSAPPLSLSTLPAIYGAEWRTATNRETCALIAPASIGDVHGAVPRRAIFSGGWAVAYDMPKARGAFGVAGTGSDADSATYEWPRKITWSDGSTAGYGPEGGTGTNQLAYVRIAGQGCLYNVWSRVSVEHLEYLLSQLRFVE